ncbi:MAG TPA: protein kinase [Gemmatimonadaceae bacterium]|nr:protein kinase [Gemmatimonadaceae bacterium]
MNGGHLTFTEHLDRSLEGRYRIERQLGRGGMATVYLAHDVRHDRSVAIKALHPELWTQSSVDRFLREIRVSARLTHPQILPLLDSGVLEEDGQPYYVMPYVGGETLDARLRREGTLTVRETARIAREMADALDYANGQGVIHRDIKPENVLLLEGHAVLTDFGIARAIDDVSGRMTSTGTIIGTPAYMSPEQASGEREITGKSDQYSLACVVYEMLTGAPPFTGNNALALLSAHASASPASVRATRTDVPRTVEAAIQRALSKNPDARFPSSTEFAAACSVTRESRASRAVWIAGGVVAAALASGAGYVAFARHPTEPPRSPTRVAVLPLRSVSPDPNDRYFAEGMTDELVSALSGIAGLTVIARSSVDAFTHGANPSDREIAKALSLGGLLEGSVRKDRNRVRISVALSDPVTSESRWTQTYDTTLDDVFAIQRDVATAVARALRVALLHDETARLERTPTSDSAAYVAYLRATALDREERVGASAPPYLDSAIALLRVAVTRDPGFAVAWAALAGQYVKKIFNFGGTPAMRDSALTAVTRALALDTALADGYRARSDLAYTREANWRNEDALRDALHAVALKPSYAAAHWTLASALIHFGLFDEARRELTSAIALDPASDVARFRQPRVEWQSQQFPAALAEYERQRKQGGVSSIDEEALVDGYLDRSPEGLELLRRYGGRNATRAGDESAAAAVLLARVGRAADARQKIADAVRLGSATSHFHHAAFAIATAWAIMNQPDSAVAWLDRTAHDGMPAYALFLRDPALAGLRGTPRYETLMKDLRAQDQRFRDIVQSFGARKG